MKGILAATMLLVSPVFIGFSGDGASVRELYERHLQRGDELYHSFDNEQALTEYRQAYAIAPDSFATLQRMVNINNDLGRLHLHVDTSAETYYRTALMYADSLAQHFPDRAESHFWLALCKGSIIPFLSVKQKIYTSRAVLEEANRAIQIDSGFALAYVVLGIFQRELSRVNWFERLIARVVFGADVSGSLETSEVLLRKSVDLDPRNSYGYFELYWTYKAMNDSTEANNSLRTLLTLRPTNARERQQAKAAVRQLAGLGKDRQTD
jgi:tetratricopeptide (TPR) repeat protein